MAGGAGAELVFVVDVTSFTEKGFVGTSSHEGKKVDIEFDDEGAGLFLSEEMAKRIGAKKGGTASVIVEDSATTVTTAHIAAVGRKVRISDAKIYYAVGREGGAIIRVRKG